MSNWNNKTEIQCLIIFKKLEEKGFPHGKQKEYCRAVSKETKISVGSLSAKVSNYKSVAGINSKSNASINTVNIYKKYNNLSINKLQKIIGSLPD